MDTQRPPCRPAVNILIRVFMPRLGEKRRNILRRDALGQRKLTKESQGRTFGELCDEPVDQFDVVHCVRGRVPEAIKATTGSCVTIVQPTIGWLALSSRCGSDFLLECIYTIVVLISSILRLS